MAANPSEITSLTLTAAETRDFLFKVDCLSWARLVAGLGQCFQSETFTVGGCDWAVRYYPHGLKSRPTSIISLVLLGSLPATVEYVTVWFGCMPDDDDNDDPWKQSLAGSFSTCCPERFSRFGDERFALRLNHGRIVAAGKEKDCFEVLCKICVLREPIRPPSSDGYGY